MWPLSYSQSFTSRSTQLREDFPYSANDRLPVYLKEGKAKQNTPLLKVTPAVDTGIQQRWPSSVHCIFVNTAFTRTQTSPFMALGIFMATFLQHRVQ